MVKRKRIGLIFKNNENWIGGTYYILNLVHALNTLPETQKPELIIYSDNASDLDMIREETLYPYLEKGNFIYTYNLFERVINKVWRSIFSRNLIIKSRNIQLDAVFPNPPNREPFIYMDKSKKIYWIPDFQEDYLPEFFQSDQIENRKQTQQSIALSNSNVIFSSKDAKDDFYRLYADANAKTFVLNFAVTHPDYNSLDIQTLKLKYNLPEKYFFCPNQFWAHKNHMVVIRAVEKLLATGITVAVVFTGKEYDFRFPDYAAQLKFYVAEKGLGKHISFLGFIDRKEQLQLMNHSIAVIQPSLFEGWSTVVEDAKAMNKYIIASDIKVHKEQIKKSGIFFSPKDPNGLAEAMKSITDSPSLPKGNAYSANIRQFGEIFIGIIENLGND